MSAPHNDFPSEVEIAKHLGLSVEEKNKPGIKAVLIEESKLISVNKDLPDIEKRVLILHEVTHYITKNFRPNSGLAHDLHAPFLDMSILDVYYREKHEGEKRYERFRKIFQHLLYEIKAGRADEYSNDIERTKAVANRHRDMIADRLSLENSLMELHTWALTERYYHIRLDRVKSWDNIEAIRVCNREIKKLAESSIKVIDRCVRNDDRMLKAMENDMPVTPNDRLGLFPDENADLVITLEKMRELIESRRNHFRSERYRWQHSLEIADKRLTASLDAHSQTLTNSKELFGVAVYTLSGGVSFDFLHRFTPRIVEMADTITQALNKHHKENELSWPLNVSIREGAILIHTGHFEAALFSLTVNHSGVSFSFETTAGAYPTTETALDMVLAILVSLRITRWNEMRISYVQFFEIDSNKLNDVRGRWFSKGLISDKARGYFSETLHNVGSSISLRFEGFDAIMSFQLLSDEKKIRSSSDFRSIDQKKYNKNMNDFFLDAHGLYIEGLRGLRQEIISDILGE